MGDVAAQQAVAPALHPAGMPVPLTKRLAKASHLAWARNFFQHALDPIRTGDGVAGLRNGALELVAADAIERRAATIQKWRFDEGILRGIIAIVASVTTAIVVRFVLSRLGL